MPAAPRPSIDLRQGSAEARDYDDQHPPTANQGDDAMTNVTRYDPFADVDDMFKGFFLRPVRMGMSDAPALGQIKVDVSEDDASITVHAEVPGAKKEDIKVSVDGNVVSISADVRKTREQKEGEKVLRSERYYGTVSRSFSLASDVDEAQCAASYKDGVLELVLPKKTGGRVRQINIT
jgi:HSP20 family protein